MTKRRVNVRGIISQGDKILAVKHINEKGQEAPYWAVPGGGLDPRESLTDGIGREIREELGIKAVVGKLLFVQQFSSHRPDYDEELEFFFHITNSNDFINISLLSTSHGTNEIARVEFIDPSQENILPKFLSHVAISKHVNGSEPVYFHNEL